MVWKIWSKDITQLPTNFAASQHTGSENVTIDKTI